MAVTTKCRLDRVADALRARQEPAYDPRHPGRWDDGDDDLQALMAVGGPAPWVDTPRQAAERQRHGAWAMAHPAEAAAFEAEAVAALERACADTSRTSCE